MRTIPGADFFTNKKVAVLGLGNSGKASVEALANLTSAQISVWDQKEDAISTYLGNSQIAKAIAIADPKILANELLSWQPDLVIISPGFPQTGSVWQTLLAAKATVWSEIELAWQLRAQHEDGSYAPWLCVTGTNGKTTTVEMLAHILNTAGMNLVPIGNIGNPAVAEVSRIDESAFPVFVLELSSFQLAATTSMSPCSAVCLNIADDHLEWHNSKAEYQEAKAQIYAHTQSACIYPVGDNEVQEMVDNADVVEGARAIGITLGLPDVGQIGIIEDLVVDRAFCSNYYQQALPLFEFADLAHLDVLGTGVPRHLLQDAMVAAALARSIDVDPKDIALGLRTFQVDAHRNELVAVKNEIRWIDDSKATNTHAALTALQMQEDKNVIWIVGGQAKGVEFTDLVTKVRSKLAGVIVIGKEQEIWRRALETVSIPKVFIDTEKNIMEAVVTKALEIALPNNVVLLSPACASLDQFVSYADRGAQFARAVHKSLDLSKGNENK